jgi:hypothetical protein
MDEEMNEQSAMDFSSLGPPIAADRFDALVAATARRGEEELQRRRGGAAVVRVVLAWRRPVLALAGLAAAAAITLFIRTPVAASTTTTAGTVAEALGIPSAYAESVEGSAQAAPHGGSEKQ